MTCPVCGGKTRVECNVSEPDCVYRKRRCKECGYRFFTEETEIGEKAPKGFYKRRIEGSNEYES